MKKKILVLIIGLFLIFPTSLIEALTVQEEYASVSVPYSKIKVDLDGYGVKNIGDRYQYLNGKPAYCINPTSDIGYYSKDPSFHSSCNSSNMTIECGFSYILSNAGGANYYSVLVALRLWANYKGGYYKGGTDGWLGWNISKQANETSNAPIYSNTAHAIINNGYQGHGNPGKNLLFQTDGTDEIDAAFNLFKSVVDVSSNNSISLSLGASKRMKNQLIKLNSNVKKIGNKVSVTKANDQIQWNSNNEGTATIRFSEKVTIDSVTSSSAVRVLSNSDLYSCSSGYCMDVNLKLISSSKDCSTNKFQLTVKYTTTATNNTENEDIPGTASLYTTPSNSLQDFIVPEEPTDPSTPPTNPTNPTSETATLEYTYVVSVDACPSVPVNTVPAECDENENKGVIEDLSFCSIIEDDSNCKPAKKDRVIAENDYCKIYERKKYEYKFMSKIESEQAISGRFFIYDIEKTGNDNDTKWLTIVNAKQEVLSGNINYIKWTKDLKEANAKVRKAYDEWQKWKALAALSGPTSHELISQKSCSRDSSYCCNLETQTINGYWDFCQDQCKESDYNIFDYVMNDYNCRYGYIYDPDYYLKQLTPCQDSEEVCTEYDSAYQPCNKTLTLYKHIWSVTYKDSYGNTKTAVESLSDTGTLTCPDRCKNNNCTITDEKHYGDSDFTEMQNKFSQNSVNKYNEYSLALGNVQDIIKQMRDCNFTSDSSFMSKLPKKSDFDGKCDLKFDFELLTGNSSEYNERYKNFVDIQMKQIGDSSTSMLYDQRDISNGYYRAYCGSSSNEGDCLKDFSSEIKSSSSIMCNTADVYVTTCNETGGCKDERFDYDCNTAILYTLSEKYGYYQAAKLATNIYFGDIKRIDPNNPGDLSNWIVLDDYSFPIDINAKDVTAELTCSVENKSQTHKITGQDIKYTCGVEDDCGPGGGNNSGNDDTCEGFCGEISNYTGRVCPCTRNCICDTPASSPTISLGDPNNRCCKNGDTTCKPDDPTLNPSAKNLGFYFRQVDLTNLFPQNRPAGRNWQGSNNVVDKIQTDGDNIWINVKANTYSDAVESQYSVTLTPDNRKMIRDYNKQKLVVTEDETKLKIYSAGYMDNSLNCDSNYKCSSIFLNSFLNRKEYAKEFSKSIIKNDIYDYDPSRHN